MSDALSALIRSTGTTRDQLASHLDALAHDERLAQVKALGRGDLKTLWNLADGAEPLDLDYFVPRTIPDLTPVPHHGINSLPAFRHFQKIFCRPANDSSRLFGYNEGATRPLIGPGFYVARYTDENAEWLTRGKVVVDYFLVPDAPVAPGWPNVVPNSSGLQRFVYYHTRDFMRRVSRHVTIGAAWKEEKALGAYFALCREDR